MRPLRAADSPGARTGLPGASLPVAQARRHSSLGGDAANACSAATNG